VWRCAIESLGTVAVPDEWSIVLALHCSRIVAIYLHALWALTALSARTFCRPMMAQVSGVLVTCRHALETRESSHIGRPSKPFFILKVYDPQRAVGHVVVLEPSRAGRRDPVP
jgi:hypothetical protein